MKDANFKNKLKDNLAAYSTPMDLEAEWAALDARRPNKRRRPIFWFWFTGLAVAILLSTILLWPDGDQENSQELLVEQSTSELKNTPNIVDSKIQNQISNQNNLNQQANKENPKAAKTTISKITTTEETKTTADPSKAINYIEPITPVLIDNTSNLFLKNLDSKGNEEKINSKILPSNQTIQLENQDSILEQKDTTLKSNSKEIALSLLPLKSTFLTIEQPIKKLELQRNSFSLQKKKMNPWSIGITAAYGKTFRNLYTSNNDLDLYLDRRKEGETLLDRWDVNLNLRRTIHKYWFAELGFGYAQATDRFEDTDVVITNDVFEDQVKSITILSDGTIRENLGDVVGEATTTIEGTYLQYYKNATIHFMLGRNIPFSKKTGTNISGGVSYSFLTRNSGTVFSDDSSLQSYADLKEGNYRTSGLLSGIAQLEFYYQISKGLQFSLGIKGEKNLNDAYLYQNGISEKRGVVGLQFGLRKGI